MEWLGFAFGVLGVLVVLYVIMASSSLERDIRHGQCTPESKKQWAASALDLHWAVALLAAFYVAMFCFYQLKIFD